MKHRKALITGGAGFVGSHLAEQLLQRGYQITILDDLSTGRFENVGHLESKDDVSLIIDTVFNECVRCLPNFKFPKTGTWPES